MTLIGMSDKQIVDTERIEKVQLENEGLWIVYKDGPGVTIKGPGITDDADLLDKVRDQEKLHYLVFRKPKSK